MINKFKEIKDIFFSSGIALLLMIICPLFDIKNDIVQYLISNVIPILIVTATVILNKPSVQLKYCTFKRRNKNIKLDFTLKYSDMKIKDSNEYKNLVKEFINNYKGDIKILRQNTGSEVCVTSFNIDGINYNID